MTAACGAGINVLRHMFHPGRMARRVHLLSSVLAPRGVEGRIDTELAGVKVPTLVVTGEEWLERVVPPRVAAGAGRRASRMNTLRSGRMRAPRRLRGQDTWGSSLVRANLPYSCRGSHLTHG